MNILADPVKVANAVMARGLKPPPPMDLNAWAEKNIVFGSESPFRGPYRRNTHPPMERILQCLSPEHPSRTVTLKASVQIFKTTVAQIFLAAIMDLDPGPFLYVLPTHDNAMRWARTKWLPMRRQSEKLRDMFGTVKTRDSTDTVLYQERRDGRGWLQISGANSEASLAMISVPRQVQDDLSKWVPNEAGDPERQADGRSSAFDWAKLFKISSPLVAKTCRISRAYVGGTQEKWHVPCPHCEHYQPLEWANFQASIEQGKEDEAHFTCVSCGGIIEHKHKLDILRRGRWVAENPSAVDVSFHIWRAYSTARDWASIASEWLAAEGDPAAEQVFFNEVLGLEFERASEAPPWEAIRDRATDYERGTVPAGALLICVGVDCQGDRTEVHVKGFGDQLRRWTIDYRVIPHHISTIECRDALDKLLFHSIGGQHIDMLAIDGNAWTNDVFGWVRERKHSWNKVIIVRGAKSDNAPPLQLTKTEKRSDGKTVKAQKRFYNVGTSGLKSSLYEQLKKLDPTARGYCGYPRGLADEFYMQLTAERREVVVDRWGFPRAVWRLAHDRNEVLDTEIYAEAAAVRCGWYTRGPENWERLRAVREVERRQASPTTSPPPQDVVARPDVLTTSAHAAKPKDQMPPSTPQPRFGRLSGMLNR